jgi:hypothetical protein
MRTDHMNTLKNDLIVIADLAVSQEEAKSIAKAIALDGESMNVSQAVKDFRQRLNGESLDINRIYIWEIGQSGDYLYLTEYI